MRNLHPTSFLALLMFRASSAYVKPYLRKAFEGRGVDEDGYAVSALLQQLMIATWTARGMVDIEVHGGYRSLRDGCSALEKT